MLNNCQRRRRRDESTSSTETIRDAISAVSLICEVADLERSSVVVALLDSAGRCDAVVDVVNVDTDDAVVELVELLSPHLASRVPGGSVVVASVRPDGDESPDDLDRWLELDACCAAHGLTLLDWFVLGASLGRPRATLGEPSRWAR